MMRAIFIFLQILLVHFSVPGQINTLTGLKECSVVIPSVGSEIIASHIMRNEKHINQTNRAGKTNSEDQILDSVLVDLGDGQRWIENQGKFEYEFDSKGNINTLIQFKKSSDSKEWVLDTWEDKEYNDLNLLTYAVKKIWNTNNQQWINQSKEVREYDLKGNQTLSSFYIWNGLAAKWIGTIKFEYDHDENNKETLYIRYLWSDQLEGWEGQFKAVRIYNTNSQIVMSNTYEWSATTMDWLKSTKQENTYTGFTSEALEYRWDDNSNGWLLADKVNTIYNEDIKIISAESYYNYFFSPQPVWKRQAKSEYSYDNSGSLRHILSYRGDSNDDWVYSYKDDFTYTGKVVDFYAGYSWDENSNVWIGGFKFERLRDGDLNQILFTTYGWDSSTNTWKEDTKNEYEYNEKGNLDKIVYYQLKNDTWDNLSKRKYYYRKEEVITALEKTHLTNEIILSPNPAGHHVELKFDSQNIEWSIMSLNGLLMSKGNMNSKDPNNNIDISALTPGMYLIEIQSDSSIVRRKFIKE